MSSQLCPYKDQTDVHFVTHLTTFLCIACHKILLTIWQEDTNDETKVREFILESFGHLFRHQSAEICMTFPEINTQCYRDYNAEECLKTIDAAFHLSRPAKIFQLPSRAVFCMA